MFCRFAGCNLWSGREEDRADAACTFCDTDFVGVDGPKAAASSPTPAPAAAIAAAWGEGQGRALRGDHRRRAAAAARRRV